MHPATPLARTHLSPHRNRYPRYMQSLAQTLKLRNSTTDRGYKDLVLDISDINSIDPARFFAETHVTKGMRDVHEAVFKRLEGTSADGIFKLTQAMGGGKTHTMLTVGLMARHPEYRGSVKGLYETRFRESANVIAFTGRNVPAGGIAGFVSDQLGAADKISQQLAKGEALDQSAWIKLLKDAGPTLILLDELPPYFAYLSSQSGGNNDRVTAATFELSNLLNALNKDELSHVALVLSDLDAGWQEGSAAIRGIVDNLSKESNRSAKRFEPVRQNSNEVYEILRKRLFEDADTETIADEVAQAYQQAVADAGKLELTQESPLRVADGIRQSYPFHPSLRDLYARFKENPGFQQTRGLIRLMRTVVTRMYDPQHGWAAGSYLIHPYDIDPNDEAVSAELGGINDKLANALSNDIASGGTAVAERVDAELNTDLASKLSRLLFVSSLSQVTSAIRGLPKNEYAAYLAAPGNDLSQLESNVLPKLRERSWYLHSDKAGRLLYRNVQNVAAKIDSYRQQLNPETVRKLVADQLRALFTPEAKDLYQHISVLEPVDEVPLERDKVSLVIYQPHAGGELHPDLQRLYDNHEFKNRLLFLTGDKLGIDTVYERARYLAAAEEVLKEFRSEQIPTNDPQYVEGETQRDSAAHGLTTAVTSVFTKVYYPTKAGLYASNISLQFRSAEERNGEEQLKKLLEEKRKFTRDISLDSFYNQLQSKLVGGEKTSVKWTEVLRKAATNTSWLFHKPNALEQAKETLIRQDRWREEGNYIKTGPFPKEPTNVIIRAITESLVRENDKLAPVRLQVTPQRGDKVYYRYGADTLTADTGIELTSPFQLDAKEEMRIAFLAVDSTGVYPTGEPQVWKREVRLQHELEQQGDRWRIELQASPASAEVFYTSDGTDPRQNGSAYSDPILERPKALVQAYAVKDGIVSEVRHIPLPDLGEQGFQIDESREATYTPDIQTSDTSTSFALLRNLRKHSGVVRGLEIVIAEGSDYLTLISSAGHSISGEQLEDMMLKLQGLAEGEGQLSLKLENTHFDKGSDFKAFAQDQALEYRNRDVDQ